MTHSIQTAEHVVDVRDDDREEDPHLLAHSYDGIREYDNPMPGWWKVIFAGSVAFAAAYGFYFHIARRGTMPDEQYRTDFAEYETKRELRMRSEAVMASEEMLVGAALDGQVLARGATVFHERCVSCHGEKGQGLIGPNLTDLHQLHGSSRMDLYATISGGVQGTAMLAWGEQMPPGDVVAAAAFVTNLRGTNVVGKEPQGNAVEKFGSQ